MTCGRHFADLRSALRAAAGGPAVGLGVKEYSPCGQHRKGSLLSARAAACEREGGLLCGCVGGMERAGGAFLCLRGEMALRSGAQENQTEKIVRKENTERFWNKMLDNGGQV